MKKKTTIITLALVTIAALGIFLAYITSDSPKPLFDINPDDVSVIQVSSGIIGERVFIEDRDDIARIVEELNNMQYTSRSTFEPTVGWWLRIQLQGADFLPRGLEIIEMGDFQYTLVNPLPLDAMFGGMEDVERLISW